VDRFYITTPIYYVNDVPHLGHAYCTVNADALARWHRLIGDETLFLTGTDEHGAKVADSAALNGVTPGEWTDRTSSRFQEAWKGLEISNDDFLRTTEARHSATVQDFLQKIYDNGFIRIDKYKGLYCVGCEDYYTEDQLNSGNCPVHGRPVVEMEEDNYFFELSKFEDRLIEWYEKNPTAIRPGTKRNEALSFIKGGLKDVSITRTSLTWGIPVPWDERHVFYVWYDALINYLTALGYGSENNEVAKWWPHVHHLIGKEIIRFHCVWWPAMCMAAGVEPPANIFVHGWLLVGGQKLSKSMASEDTGPVKLTEITPASLTEDFGIDAVRYHLLRDVPLGTDGEFSIEGMTLRYNADLANNLGNLVSRVATVVGSKCGGIAPSPDEHSPLAAAARDAVTESGEAWERFAPHEALEATWRLIGAANAELERTEPWKAEAGSVDDVLGSAVEAVRIVTILASPALPAICAEIWRRFGFAGTLQNQHLPADGLWGAGQGGQSVEKGEPLFPRRTSGS
jgi:methionyl-tRNA synthetase